MRSSERWTESEGCGPRQHQYPWSRHLFRLLQDSSFWDRIWVPLFPVAPTFRFRTLESRTWRGEGEDKDILRQDGPRAAVACGRVETRTETIGPGDRDAQKTFVDRQTGDPSKSSPWTRSPGRVVGGVVGSTR